MSPSPSAAVLLASSCRFVLLKKGTQSMCSPRRTTSALPEPRPAKKDDVSSAPAPGVALEAGA